MKAVRVHLPRTCEGIFVASFDGVVPQG
jgi:hypothetical protein